MQERSVLVTHLRLYMTRHAACQMFRYAWAAPNTALGLSFGLIGWLFGARARFNDGTVEFYGGRLLHRAGLLPPRFSFCAITFGHVILLRIWQRWLPCGHMKRCTCGSTSDGARFLCRLICYQALRK
jgi:hypothetical protein